MSNLPVLWRNTLAGLGEESGALYLRGAARNELKAFDMACCWEDAGPIIAHMIGGAAQTSVADAAAYQRVTSELFAFFKERHFRRYFPDGRDV